MVKRNEKLENYEVKIIDFGLSKFENEIYKGLFAGTEGYMCPEMVTK
jgi:serine/threonine protein kinase